MVAENLVNLQTEEEICRKIAEKDFSGLELLIEVYSFHIRQVILQTLGHNTKDLGDLENEIYFKLWQKIPLFNPEKARLKTWLETLVKNHVLDYLRKNQLQVDDLSLEEVPQTFLISEHPLEKEDFLSLLTSLKPLDQEIFYRYYFYEESAEEIAKVLDLKVDKIYNRLSRGRKKLAKTLKKGAF